MDIQVGGRVYWRYIDVKAIHISIITSETDLELVKHSDKQILKIERPKYEVVEEKKELLTEEEKEFLKQNLKFGNFKSGTSNKIIQFIIKNEDFIYLHTDEFDCVTVYFDKNLYFRNLEENKKYTLKELELEEN